MSRCQNCNKFTALEFQDPEENSWEDDDVKLDPETGTLAGEVVAEVRIVRNLECCGDEAKDATLDLRGDFEVDHDKLADHLTQDETTKQWSWKEGHDLVIEHDDPEQVEEGGGRYKKSYFGASISYTVECKCGETFVVDTIEDKVAASGMDDLL